MKKRSNRKKTGKLASPREAWRPEGWHLPFGVCDHGAKEGEIASVTLLSEQEKVLFEAGASAMLKALFNLAKESPTGTFVIDSHIERR